MMFTVKVPPWCFGVSSWVLLQYKVRKKEASNPNQSNHGASTPSTWEALDLVLLETLTVHLAVILEEGSVDLSLAQVQCRDFHQVKERPVRYLLFVKALGCDLSIWATTSCSTT